MEYKLDSMYCTCVFFQTYQLFYYIKSNWKIVIMAHTYVLFVYLEKCYLLLEINISFILLFSVVFQRYKVYLEIILYLCTVHTPSHSITIQIGVYMLVCKVNLICHFDEYSILSHIQKIFRLCIQQAVI